MAFVADLKASFKRNAPVTVTGVLLFALFTNLLYDLLVKPGLTVGGRAVLAILTLGSSRLKDVAYAEAALDPTPVAALGMMFVLFGMSVARPLLGILFNAHRPRDDEREYAAQDDGPEAHLGRRKQLFRLKVAHTIVAVCTAVLLIVYLAIHNQSVVVWRVFHANLAIVRPAISDDESLELLSMFARMQSKAEYARIEDRLKAAANRKGLRLRDVSLW